MGINHETLREICDRAAAEVRVLYPNLELMFIMHARGMFHEIVETSEHQVLHHPAGDIAQSILDKNNNREQSSFLGMAIHNDTRWLGFVSKDHLLALFNINTDEFENLDAARRAIYHLAWHAMDLTEIRQRPEYSDKFKSGPMIPKRSAMNLARLNLQADVFSGVMSALHGEENAIGNIAKQRAFDSLDILSIRRAEDYPFCIALESADYAYGELSKLKISPTKYIHYARQMAVEVTNTFNDTNIRRWWGYATPAQDMIWRDIRKEIVLGCAMYTSEDPYVRAIGHLVYDVTQIHATDGEHLTYHYNSFANPEQRKALHKDMVEKALEDAIAIGVVQESGQPLLSAANEQNENLAEGRILGWCANAMQAAARAFENALSSGASPAVAARLEFEGTKHNPDWDSLKKVGDDIVDQKRGGFGVTLGNVAELCSQSPAFSGILNAIKVTMNDPTYIRKLEAANDMLLGVGPKPSMAGPSKPALGPQGPAGPQMAYAPAAPTLGGGGSAARNLAFLQRIAKSKQAQKAQDSDDKSK